MYRAAAALLVVALSACGPKTDPANFPCPPSGTDLTYENFGQSFFGGYCQGCHGAPVGERDGAPLGYDFGSHDAVLFHKERIFIRAAADNTTMPPGPDDPPEEARFDLAVWLACGAP